MSDAACGLYQKYRVERMDGSGLPGRKHADCEYFVLDLTHDRHAKAALLAYAESCKTEYPLRRTLPGSLLHHLRGVLRKLRGHVKLRSD